MTTRVFLRRYGVIGALLFSMLALNYVVKTGGLNLVEGAFSLGAHVGAAEVFFQIARGQRVPFRDIMRLHPTLPEDTMLYFVEPPYQSTIPDLSGMFFPIGAKLTYRTLKT